MFIVFVCFFLEVFFLMKTGEFDSSLINVFELSTSHEIALGLFV